MSEPADAPSPPPSSSADDLARAKRERILAVSRTIHQVPVEEGGMLKRKPEPGRPEPSREERFWRRSALAAGGVASLAVGLAAGLWLRRR